MNTENNTNENKTNDLFSSRSIFYISMAVILIGLFDTIKNVTIQFIMSSNQPAVIVQPEPPLPQFPFPMFRGPHQEPQPQSDTPQTPRYNL